MLKYAALAAGAIALAGCNGVATTAGDIALVVAHSAQACMDLQLLGEPVGVIATQVSAANPNNTNIQYIVSRLSAGVALGNSDCQLLAASFTAEAPKSLLTKEIKIDQATLSKIR